ncbi:MAG: hypothetical protein ACRC7H_01370 [Plesiomonas shigelloides]
MFCSLYIFKEETDRIEESDEERDTSEESEECDPEYVPDSESETDDEHAKSMAKSPILNKDSLLGWSSKGVDINENLNGGGSANEISSDKTSEDRIQSTAVETSDTVQSTAVSFGGQNICFVCQKPVFKIARHFKMHIKEDGDIAKAQRPGQKPGRSCLRIFGIGETSCTTM